MEWLIIAGVLLAIVIIAIAAYQSKNKWKVLMEDRQMSDSISKSYSHLKDNEIRCRLRQAPTKPAGTGPMASASVMMDQDRYEKYILEVHKDDLQKAESVLSELRQGESQYSPPMNIV